MSRRCSEASLSCPGADTSRPLASWTSSAASRVTAATRSVEQAVAGLLEQQPADPGDDDAPTG